jgi:hypothetical protein
MVNILTMRLQRLKFKEFLPHVWKFRYVKAIGEFTCCVSARDMVLQSSRTLFGGV